MSTHLKLSNSWTEAYMCTSIVYSLKSMCCTSWSWKFIHYPNQLSSFGSAGDYPTCHWAGKTLDRSPVLEIPCIN